MFHDQILRITGPATSGQVFYGVELFGVVNVRTGTGGPPQCLRNTTSQVHSNLHSDVYQTKSVGLLNDYPIIFLNAACLMCGLWKNNLLQDVHYNSHSPITEAC